MTAAVCAKEALCRQRAQSVVPPGSKLAADLKAMGEPAMQAQFAVMTPETQKGIIETYERIYSHFSTAAESYATELKRASWSLTTVPVTLPDGSDG